VFYEAITTGQRNFSRHIEYKSIDFTKLSSIIPAFRARIEEWYILPAKELANDWHNAFSVLALDCLLIDAMGKYCYAAPGGSVRFIDYLETEIPKFGDALAHPIRFTGRVSPHNSMELRTAAQVIYYAYRCPILHEAHIFPFAGVLPETNIFRNEPSGKAKYSDKTDCPAFYLNPVNLLSVLVPAFHSSTANLLDSDTTGCRLSEPGLQPPHDRNKSRCIAQPLRQEHPRSSFRNGQ